MSKFKIYRETDDENNALIKLRDAGDYLFLDVVDRDGDIREQGIILGINDEGRVEVMKALSSDYGIKVDSEGYAIIEGYTRNTTEAGKPVHVNVSAERKLKDIKKTIEKNSHCIHGHLTARILDIIGDIYEPDSAKNIDKYKKLLDKIREYKFMLSEDDSVGKFEFSRFQSNFEDELTG